MKNPILADDNLCDDPSVGKSSFSVAAGTSRGENVDGLDIVYLVYTPILPVSTKRLFGLLEVPSVVYGCVNIFLTVYGYVSFVMSYSLQLHGNTSDYTIGVQRTTFAIFTFFVVGTWIVIPLAQSLNCAEVGKSPLVSRIEITRYMPMSLYNHFFLVANPGFELNPRLPTDIENIGLYRSGAFNMCCFYRAFLAVLLVMYSTSFALDKRDGSSSAYYSYVSLFITVVLNMKISLVTLWYTPRLIPLVCSEFFRMKGNVGPERGTLRYRLVMEFWNRMAQ